MHTDELKHQWKSEFSGMKSLTCKNENILVQSEDG
jgi:hypothetical protein